MTVTEDIRYLGVNDKNIRLFEGQYAVDGMAYNSYLIFDEKIAVFDTVDEAVSKEWFEKLERELQGRLPDYLIIQHMEPDHSANIFEFYKRYPNIKIVASPKAFIMMKSFFGADFAAEQIAVRDGERINLGKHALRFIEAPMVHWPEVIVTYDERDKALFSADAFGRFGTTDRQGDWACEARRYYFGIVGKYGVQVQNLFKKLSALEIRAICPLHGVVLKENLGYYFGLYNTWSKYEAESEGVTIAYTSVYGNTKKAVELLAEKLKEKGQAFVVHDLARCDMSETIEDAFRYGKIVLATTTYNGGIFPFMRTFIHELTEHNFQNREVGFIENGSWSPVAARTIKGMLENSKNLRFLEPVVTIRSALTEENERQIEDLAKELCN